MQEVSEDNKDNFTCEGSDQATYDQITKSEKPMSYPAEETHKKCGINNDEIDVHDNDEEEDNVNYHSDSDSTIMMSGNSPFVSKAARYNFLCRSSKFQGTTLYNIIF